MKTKIIMFASIFLSVLMIQNLAAQNKTKRNSDQDNSRMYNRLNLSEEQQDQISTMKINHQMEMVDLKADLKKQELELTSLKNQGNYSREQYLAAINSINAARDNIAISRAEFQMDVYQLLDEKQKEEWNKSSLYFSEKREKRVMKKFRESEQY
ncbi:MAG: hypothetical protein R3321_13595 [Nitrososphaeraceae archaeon]|nr:hypothetical protein [Nitrososphaeraceae archaeon]